MNIEKALLIHNEAAGTAAGSMVGAAAGVLTSVIPELVIVRTMAQGDGERICRERGEEVNAVFILGGDGTVHECINGLAGLERPPVVGILPGGTCNDFARTLGLPVNVAEAAEALIQSKPMRIDLGIANKRVFTNFFGIGLITETSENVDSSLKGSLGKLSYFISTLQTIRAAKPFRYQLQTENTLIEDEAVMIYISNGKSLGTSSLPFSKDALTDGEFDVLIIRETGIPLLRELLARKPEGEWEPRNDSVKYFKASRINLVTETEMPADTDGEIYLSTPAEIKLLEHKLKFLIPQAADDSDEISTKSAFN
ncbi:YegS/Rv2252/BmrU family lipid kinase [Neobacillus mesonae]|nr:YegS/Rv2252/BmrU family lipid kinase [Neobacillus mesonae]